MTDQQKLSKALAATIKRIDARDTDDGGEVDIAKADASRVIDQAVSDLWGYVWEHRNFLDSGECCKQLTRVVNEAVETFRLSDEAKAKRIDALVASRKAAIKQLRIPK